MHAWMMILPGGGRLGSGTNGRMVERTDEKEGFTVLVGLEKEKKKKGGGGVAMFGDLKVCNGCEKKVERKRVQCLSLVIQTGG